VSALRSFDRWWSDAMHDPAISRHGHDDSGSTAALALAAPAPGPPGGWRLAVANLGDSSALLVNPDGSVSALSELHNTGNPSELERLLVAGAQVVHPQPGADGAGLADGHARFFPKGPIWGKRGLKVSRCAGRFGGAGGRRQGVQVAGGRARGGRRPLPLSSQGLCRAPLTLDPQPPASLHPLPRRALGDVHFKRPAQLVSTDPFTTEVLVPPGPGPRLLLLVTDGVTDVLDHERIAALALAALARPPEARLAGLPPHDDDARAAAAAVVAAAAAHELAHDNMTCAALVFGPC
jgi:serine/threonine protein phosphatase PrpC